ncbi:MAG: chemotaxis protein CheW [Myxococcales bacterium]|nr:chemotaxis protein CheW [Myxococcales bacterium]
MSDGPRDLNARVASLRQAFDAAFAAPLRPPDADPLDVLVVALGDAAMALRVTDLIGLERGRRVVGLPGAAPALRGLAGVRGEPIAVYDLGRLLGLGPTEPTWLALTRAAPDLALGFDRLVGFRRLPAAEVEAARRATDAVDRVVHTSEGPVGLLNTKALIEAAQRDAATTGER